MEIPLTCGQFAIVDEADFAMLCSMGKWHARYNPSSRSYYASRGRLSKGTGKHVTTNMHRVILGVTDTKIHVDHINKDTLDNRRANIRAVTQAENNCNHQMRRDNTSGHKGIRRVRETWRVTIQKDKKKYHLGYFTDLQDAINTRIMAAKELFGEFYREETTVPSKTSHISFTHLRRKMSKASK